MKTASVGMPSTVAATCRGRLRWCCHGAAVGLPWRCSGAVVAVQWRCSGADLHHLDVQALAHVDAAVRHQHRAVAVHVHERARLGPRVGSISSGTSVGNVSWERQLGASVGNVSWERPLARQEAAGRAWLKKVAVKEMPNFTGTRASPAALTFSTTIQSPYNHHAVYSLLKMGDPLQSL